MVPTAPIPTIVTWNSYKIEEPAFSDVVASGVPTFRSFRNCFSALRAFYDYQARRPTLRNRPELVSPVSDAVREALADGGTLDADRARIVLTAFGVPLAGEVVVQTADAAVAAADLFGYRSS